MKKILILLTFVIIFFSNDVLSQVQITSDCNKILKVVTPLTENFYPVDAKLYTEEKKNCESHLLTSTPPMNLLLTLQKKDCDNTWKSYPSTFPIPPDVTLSQITLSNTIGHGTYRFVVKIPEKAPNNGCEFGGVRVFDLQGNFKGFKGFYNVNTYTDEFYIGETNQNDIAFQWIKTQGTPPPANLSSPPIYCFEENPKINTQGTCNYSAYWVAIFEQGLGTTNRYATTGWVLGKIPNNEIDLIKIWKDVFGSAAEFDPISPNANPSYQVQFAITNSCNSAWTTISNPMPFFQKRPQGWGCKNTDDDFASIKIMPNPTRDYFNIPAIENDDSNITVSINDMSGRLVKQYNNAEQQYDISELNNGMYIVSILKEGIRVHSSKLSVIN